MPIYWPFPALGQGLREGDGEAKHSVILANAGPILDPGAMRSDHPCCTWDVRMARTQDACERPIRYPLSALLPRLSLFAAHPSKWTLVTFHLQPHTRGRTNRLLLASTLAEGVRP